MDLFHIRITSFLIIIVKSANLGVYRPEEGMIQVFHICNSLLHNAVMGTQFCAVTRYGKDQWSGSPIYALAETSETSQTLSKIFLIYRKIQFDTQGSNDL